MRSAEDQSRQPVTRAEPSPPTGIGTPLALRYIRRELDRRVRASEAALGRE